MFWRARSKIVRTYSPSPVWRLTSLACDIGAIVGARPRFAGRLPRRGPRSPDRERVAARAGMIGSTRSLRVWAYPAPTDLRKGFDGLCGLVTERHQDPLVGDCFLFVNRLR